MLIKQFGKFRLVALENQSIIYSKGPVLTCFIEECHVDLLGKDAWKVMPNSCDLADALYGEFQTGSEPEEK